MKDRQRFIETIDDMLNHVEEDKVLALLVVKVWRFKDINSTYGYKFADEFLNVFESRLHDVLRPVDVIGKTGDNEFGIILPGLFNCAHAILAANKIITEFHQAVVCDGKHIKPKVIIGIAVSPDHGKTHEDLLQNAAAAVNNAEESGDQYCVYEAEEDTGLPSKLILEQEIYHAFEHDEFDLYYQPKIDMKTGQVSGAEALLRWFSAKYGAVNTQHFINVLENSNMMLSVTKWVLNASLRQCVKCGEDLKDFKIAINISPSLLHDKTIVNMVRDALNIWDANPANVILEVTEGAMIKNPEMSLQILRELHELGVGISIDDFGTGYSSLSYMRDLPADELKIDRSFVMSMLNSPRDLSIVKAIINLAHTLGLQVVAEGIETREIMEKLQELGCDTAQGYFFARPMPYDDMYQWLEAFVHRDHVSLH